MLIESKVYEYHRQPFPNQKETSNRGQNNLKENKERTISD